MSPVKKIPPGLRHGLAAAAPAAPADETQAHVMSSSPGHDSQPEHRPRREKPKRTRYTLDLDPDQHAFLKAYAQRIEADASEVMRALLRELEADPGLAERVRGGIWQQS